MAVGMAVIYIYSLDVIWFQITAFSGIVVFRKIIFSNVGDLINFQGVTKARRDRCMRSATQFPIGCFITVFLVLLFLFWEYYSMCFIGLIVKGRSFL
jgi:hypothetical protein